MEMLPALAGPIIGGLLGNNGNSQSQTTQNTVDPRFAEYMYGGNGVLPAAKDWYAKNKTGMNEQMATGMNNQWNQLGGASQGFNQMQNLGMGLMGGGVAGNPFHGGTAAPQGAQGSQPQSYQPAQMSMGGTSGPFSGQAPQTLQAPPPAAPTNNDSFINALRDQAQYNQWNAQDGEIKQNKPWQGNPLAVINQNLARG